MFQEAPGLLVQGNVSCPSKVYVPVLQEHRGGGGVPESLHPCGEGPGCDPGGAAQDEDGHQGPGGQPGHQERGTSHAHTML